LPTPSHRANKSPCRRLEEKKKKKAFVNFAARDPREKESPLQRERHLDSARRGTNGVVRQKKGRGGTSRCTDGERGCRGTRVFSIAKLFTPLGALKKKRQRLSKRVRKRKRGQRRCLCRKKSGGLRLIPRNLKKGGGIRGCAKRGGKECPSAPLSECKGSSTLARPERERATPDTFGKRKTRGRAFVPPKKTSTLT